MILILSVLQKQPMKLMPQGRPMPPGMFPMRGDGGPTGPMMKGPMGMAGPGEPDMSSVEQWVQQQNNNLQQGSYQQMGLQQMNNFGGAGGMPPPGNPYLQASQGMPSWPPESISPHGLSPADEFLSGPPMVGPGASHPLNNQTGFGHGGPPPHMMPGGPHINLQQNKVPNENLTPEQLQRREEQLAHIRKLHQLLLPEQQPPPTPGSADMLGPGSMMGPQPGSMMGPVDMVHTGSPLGMMGGPPPHGQSPVNMPPYGMRGLPPNWENLSVEQREWYKVQQEYFAEKMRKQQLESMHYQQMQPMGMPPSRHPSPFYAGMPQRHGMMDSMSPSSPSFNGPMPPHPGLDPRLSPMPGEPPDFMRAGMPPGPPRPMPGGHMNCCPGMPMHPVGFDPNMEPSLTDFMFPSDDMMKVGGSGQMVRNLPPMMRAGNPEQFHPELMGPGGVHINSNGPKAPPAYSHKRKRSGEDMDEIYKKLQPAPSPQQFSYLNQFEGQELTITRQLNLAYQEPSQNASSPLVSQTQPLTPAQLSEQQQQQQPVPSPASRNGASGAVSRSTPVSAAASPLAVTTSASSRPSSVNVTAVTSLPLASSSSVSTVSMQQTQNSVSQRTNSHDSIQHIPVTSKSSLTTNITSSSLEKLAKGVEQLSNQMQQSMSQGGPFHNVQVQTPGSDAPTTLSSVVASGSSTLVSQTSSLNNNSLASVPISANQSNVHSLPEQSQMTLGVANQSPMSMSGQAQGPNHGGFMSGPNGFDPMARFGPGMGSNRSMPMAGGNNGPTPPIGFCASPQGGMLSPGYQRPMSGSTMGNANVQIQPKAPNTIQYMPVTNAPSSTPGNRHPPMLKDFDLMSPRMPSPGLDRPPLSKRSAYSPIPPDMMMGPRMQMQGQGQMGMPSMMMQGGNMHYGSPGPVHMSGRSSSPSGMMNCPPDMYPMQSQQHMPMSVAGMMMGPGGPIRPEMGPMMGGNGQNPPYNYDFQQFQQQLYANNNRQRPYGQMVMGGPGMGAMMGGPIRPNMMESDMGSGMMMGMGGGRLMGPGGPTPGMGGPMGMNMLPNMP